MSRSPIFATRRVLEDPRRLGLERPLENVLEEARDSGRKRKQPPAGLRFPSPLAENERFVIASATLAVVLRRVTSPLGADAWLAVRLFRLGGQEGDE